MSSGCGDVLSLADLQTAKKHQIFEAEVITGKQGGVATGADIDYATNQVTGQTQKTLPAVLRDSGYRPASFTFTTGGTLAVGDEYRAVLWPLPSGDGLYYFWSGSFPKTIPAGSTPSSTGGVSAGAWLPTTGVSRPYSVSFTQFGAAGDGVTNDAPAIAAALNYALANNLDVRQSSGTFLLDGGTYLDIKSLNVDLTGSVLKPSATWTGQIAISQPDAPVTYGPGSDPVNGVNASTVNSRGVGSNYLDGLASNTDLDGCFIQLSTSQPMFIFDGVNQTRVDFNRVYNRGYIENPLKYALGTNATSIKALKIRKDVQTIKGLTIDESLTKNYRIIYINQASRVRLINTSFINRPITQNFNDTRLEIHDSYDVIVDGLYAPAIANALIDGVDSYAYAIGLGESMNVTIKNATANGQGWGATGSNNCANIRFERCDLSRIDFHRPFQNYLKINDCNIGVYGVLASGIGDLYVTNSAFNASPYKPGNIIATRADAGGFFDGDLYMENIKLTGLRNGVPGNGIINASVTAGQGPSSGSPISPTLFNNITLKDIKMHPGTVVTYPGTLITVNRDNTLYFPKKIVIDGLDFGTLPKSAGVGLNIDFSRFKALYSDMNNSENAVTGRHTTDILINDVCTPFFSVTSASFRHNPRVVASNVRHGVPGEAYTMFETNQRGSYELTDCKFERIRAYYGGDPNGPVSIKMKGGKLWSASPTLSPIDGTTVHDITLDNVQIVGAFLSQDQTTFPVTRGLISRALVRNCEFWDVTGVKQPKLPFISVESTSTTVSVPFKVGQQFAIATGFTAGSTYTITNAKAIGDSGAKQNFNIGTAGSIILTYTVSGANVTQIVMTSPAGNDIRTLAII